MRAARLSVVLTSFFGSLIATPALAQVPYFQNFDTFSLCTASCGATCNLSQGWTNLGGDQTNWTIDVAGTTSSNTGPSRDHTTGTTSGRYLYTEATSCFNRRAEVASPVFNLTGTTSPILQFWYHMYGSNMGTLHVDVIRDPAGAAVRTNDIIPPLTDNRNLWQQVTCVPLDPTASAQVIFRGITGPSFRSDMAIDDVEIRNLPGVDVELADVRVNAGCAGTPGSIEVTLENNGGNVTTVPIVVSANGTTLFTENLQANLQACLPGSTFTLTTPLNLPIGTTNLTVRAAAVGDSVSTNDAQSRTVHVQPVLSTFPYSQGFEAANHGWVTGGTASTWARGLPADAVINSAFNGSNAFVTGLSTDYAANEVSYLEAPCFDFSALTNPRIEARVWWESVAGRDGAQVQVSTNGGGTWQTVGSSFSPGWYNSGNVVALQSAVSSGYGFAGRTDSSNGSGGWLRVGHDLGNMTAGASAVRLRVVFASDASVQDEGFAIDDVRIVDNLPRIEVTDGVAPAPSVALRSGEQGRLLLALDAAAVLGPNDLTGLVLARLGTMGDADVARVTVWRDNGDLRFEANRDFNLGSAAFVAGRAQVTLSPPVSINANQTRRLFVTADLAPTVAAGRTLGVELTAATDVLGPARVELPDGAVGSTLMPMVSAEAALPFADGFEGALPANRSGATAGAHPVATSTASPVTIAPPAAAPGAVRVAASVDAAGGPLLPRTGAQMFVLDFPTGTGVAALDHHFDLSAFDPNVDDIFYEVAWRGVTQADDPADHIFLSADGGATWIASLYDFTPPTSPGWGLARVDLSAAFRAAGIAFAADVVVRVQAAGGGSQGPLLLDDAWLGVPERVAVRRSGGPPIFSGQPESLGSVPGGAPTSVDLEIVNLGQRNLQIQRRFQVRNGVGVAGVGTSGSGPTSLAPGTSAPLTLFFTPIDVAFGFELSFPVSDPRLPAGEFVLPLFGTGQVEPEIEVRGADGAPVSSGAVEALGRMRVGGDVVRRSFTVHSLGTGTLALTGTPPVVFTTSDNTDARVLSQPAASLPPGASEGFEIQVAPLASGPFSAELLLTSTDGDEGSITLRFEGEGSAPELEVSRDGVVLVSGSDDDLGTLTVGAPTTVTYRISNLGNFPLRFVDLPRVRLIANQNVLTTANDPQEGTLEPGAFVDVELGLEPRSDGPFRADLVILTDDDDESEFRAQLIGTGRTPRPELRLRRGDAVFMPDDTDMLAVSEVGAPQTLDYEIENAGDQTLFISGDITTDGEQNVGVLVTEISTASVAPGSSVPLEVVYTPEAEGDLQFSLRIFSDDPSNPLFRISVVGSAVTIVPDLVIEQPEGEVRPSGSVVRMADVPLGGPTRLSITLRNVGTGVLAFTGESPVTIDELTNVAVQAAMQPAATLAPGGTAVLDLDVTPAALGAFSAAVHVASDDPETPDVTIRVAGTGVAAPVLDEGGGCTCVTDPLDGATSGWLGASLLALLGLGRRRRSR